MESAEYFMTLGDDLQPLNLFFFAWATRTQMFDLVDKDQNGTISFHEFLDLLVIFSKGSAEDKLKLLFDMYDTRRTGRLMINEFTLMISWVLVS